MTKSVLEVLTIARRDVLATPDNWAQHWFAFNSVGEHVSSDAATATCFCTWGAIYRAAETNEDGTAPPANLAGTFVEKAIHELFPERSDQIPDFNDHDETTYEDVLKVFDRAIELAGAC